MGVPHHLGEQFADLLGRVNDRFDVEYGPDPRMARVGRLHLPVSKGLLVLNHEFPKEEHLVMTLPDETGGHGVMQFNPDWTPARPICMGEAMGTSV